MNWTKELDRMINAVPKRALKQWGEFWVASNIYKELNLKEYKGYKIYTSKWMVKDHMEFNPEL